MEPEVVEAANAKTPDDATETESSTKPLSAMGRAIERLKSKKDLKIQKESVLEGKKQFQCNICELEFHNKINLKRHIISIHDRFYKPIKCNLCDYETVCKANLKTHKDSVHERNKPFKCKTCDYKAAKKWELKKFSRYGTR